MITKERLRELIKQDDKKIYWSCKGNNFSTIQEYDNLREFASLILESIDNIEESVFETKEEAEWEMKFGDVKRTEKLGLPTWEQFMLTSDGVEFTAKNGDKIRFHKISDYTESRITVYDKNGKESIDEEWEATKENYIEACKLCKKLFLGEYNDK